MTKISELPTEFDPTGGVYADHSGSGVLTPTSQLGVPASYTLRQVHTVPIPFVLLTQRTAVNMLNSTWYDQSWEAAEREDGGHWFRPEIDPARIYFPIRGLYLIGGMLTVAISTGSPSNTAVVRILDSSATEVWRNQIANPSSAEDIYNCWWSLLRASEVSDDDRWYRVQHLQAAGTTYDSIPSPGWTGAHFWAYLYDDDGQGGF